MSQKSVEPSKAMSRQKSSDKLTRTISQESDIANINVVNTLEYQDKNKGKLKSNQKKKSKGGKHQYKSLKMADYFSANNKSQRTIGQDTKRSNTGGDALTETENVLLNLFEKLDPTEAKELEKKLELDIIEEDQPNFLFQKGKKLTQSLINSDRLYKIMGKIKFIAEQQKDTDNGKLIDYGQIKKFAEIQNVQDQITEINKQGQQPQSIGTSDNESAQAILVANNMKNTDEPKIVAQTKDQMWNQVLTFMRKNPKILLEMLPDSSDNDQIFNPQPDKPDMDLTSDARKKSRVERNIEAAEKARKLKELASKFIQNREQKKQQSQRNPSTVLSKTTSTTYTALTGGTHPLSQVQSRQGQQERQLATSDYATQATYNLNQQRKKSKQQRRIFNAQNSSQRKQNNDLPGHLNPANQGHYGEQPWWSHHHQIQDLYKKKKEAKLQSLNKFIEQNNDSNTHIHHSRKESTSKSAEKYIFTKPQSTKQRNLTHHLDQSSPSQTFKNSDVNRGVHGLIDKTSNEGASELNLLNSQHHAESNLMQYNASNRAATGQDQEILKPQNMKSASVLTNIDEQVRSQNKFGGSSGPQKRQLTRPTTANNRTKQNQSQGLNKYIVSVSSNINNPDNRQAANSTFKLRQSNEAQQMFTKQNIAEVSQSNLSYSGANTKFVTNPVDLKRALVNKSPLSTSQNQMNQVQFQSDQDNVAEKYQTNARPDSKPQFYQNQNYFSSSSYNYQSGGYISSSASQNKAKYLPGQDNKLTQSRLRKTSKFVNVMAPELKGSKFYDKMVKLANKEMPLPEIKQQNYFIAQHQDDQILEGLSNNNDQQSLAGGMSSINRLDSIERQITQINSQQKIEKVGSQSPMKTPKTAEGVSRQLSRKFTQKSNSIRRKKTFKTQEQASPERKESKEAGQQTFISGVTNKLLIKPVTGMPDSFRDGSSHYTSQQSGGNQSFNDSQMSGKFIKQKTQKTTVPMVDWANTQIYKIFMIEFAKVSKSEPQEGENPTKQGPVLSDESMKQIREQISFNKEKNMLYFTEPEVEYTINMIKNRFKDFKRTDAMRPFFVKSTHTLGQILNESSLDTYFQRLSRQYKEITIENTMKLLIRCRLAFQAREMITDTFRCIIEYEKSSADFKQYIAQFEKHQVEPDQLLQIQKLSSNLFERGQELIHNIRNLKESHIQFRNSFIFKRRDMITHIKIEINETRRMAQIFKLEGQDPLLADHNEPHKKVYGTAKEYVEQDQKLKAAESNRYKNQSGLSNLNPNDNQVRQSVDRLSYDEETEEEGSEEEQSEEKTFESQMESATKIK